VWALPGGDFSGRTAWRQLKQELQDALWPFYARWADRLVNVIMAAEAFECFRRRGRMQLSGPRLLGATLDRA